MFDADTTLHRLLSRMSRSFRRGRRPTSRARSLAKPRLEPLEDRTLPAVVTWTGAVSNAWNVAGNWSTNHLPGAADDVVINAPATTVVHSAGTDSVHSLTSNAVLTLSGGSLSLGAVSTLNNDFNLSGGTLGGVGDLTVNGLLNWTSGTLSGAGHVEADGGMLVSTASGHSLIGRTLDNPAEADWTGTGGVSFSGNAVWNNLPTGSVVVTGDAALSGNGGTFNNAGLFTKTAGTGTTSIGVTLNNSGVVDAASGTVNVSGRDITTGAFTVEAGGTLAFNGNTQVLRAGSSVSGAGNVLFAGANITLLGNYAVSGNTTVSSGTVQFDTGATLATLTLSGGTLGGTAAVTVNGLLTWTGGTMNGGGTTFAAGGASISGTNDKQLSNRILDNAGEADWTGTGNLLMNSNSVWNNLPGSSLIARNDSQLGGGNGSQYTGSTFDNAGLFRKVGGTATTTVVALVNNTGVLDAASGTLNLADGGLDDAAYTVEAGATLGLTGGYHALDANSSVSGAGDVLFSGGGSADLSGAYTVTGNTTVAGGSVTFAQDQNLTTLTVSGGTLTVDGYLTLSGLLTWTGGTMNGGGETFADGGIALGGGNGRTLDARTLNNAGTATWTGTGGISLVNNAVWNNLGGSVLDIQSDAAFGGSSATFNNGGTVRKSAGTGTTTFNVYLVNGGVVDAASGTLSLPGGGLNGGTYTAEAGATLLFGGGEHSFSVGSDINGAGNVVFGGANVTSDGGYDLTGTTTIANGTVDFDVNVTVATLTFSGGTLTGDATVTVSGVLTWTGGQMIGGGVTFAAGGLVISGSNGKALYGRTLDNAGAGVWSGGDINVEYDAVWNNLPGAVMDVQSNNRFGTDSVFHAEGTFNNYGTFQKSAGTGTTYGDIAFNNNGTVDAQSGLLDLAGGGISGGAFIAEAGASLDFGGGPHFLTPTSSVTGDGTVIFDSETFNGLSMTITGTYNVTGTTTFQATNAPFGAPPVEFDADATLGNLNLGAGSLTAVGNVTVNGLFRWTGGTLGGIGNVFVNGGLVISTGITLDSATLNNAGTATWTGSGSITFSNNAVWNNLPGSVLDIQGSGGANGSGTFVNLGTVQKLTGPTTAPGIGATFYNFGLVDVEAGRLNFGNGFNNAGSVTLVPTATLGVSGTYSQTGGTIALNGGTLLAGTVDLEGGVLTGPGTIGAPSALTNVINAAEIDVGTGGVTGTLTINGSYTQTAAGVLVIQVGGPTPGTDTDKLVVTRQATLDGSLTVVLLNGFVPGPLSVVTFQSHSGTFASLDGDGALYTATYTATSLTLS